MSWTACQRWDETTTRWNTWLHERCSHGDQTVQRWVQRTYPWNVHQLPTPLKKALWTVQDGRCYWCQRSMRFSEATLEHVIPFGSPIWTRLRPLEQLLSFRMSHAACNRAYNTWRLADLRHATAMDLWRLRHIRHLLRQDPLWACWIPDAIPLAPAPKIAQC
ncbi:hypothetical protein [Sulfobacillus thermosulfidooxidans]|uniref:hypothetical protein n=1 Tax=Sulfobacillus thermosulfidooxidans TaxID=28034 RepID=UPI0003037A18|nr:hypothetical protein [Sulfobacillus thermosulfidooxidans]